MNTKRFHIGRVALVAAVLITLTTGVVAAQPWVQQAKLVAPDGAQDDFLGWEVAISGDGSTALVGVRGSDPGGNSNQGAAYVFVRDNGVWVLEQKLTGSDGAPGDLFGEQVALSADGNTALVGAIWANVEGQSNQGAAYVFVRSGSVWTEQAKLTASDGNPADEFGRVALSADGNTAAVGARVHDAPQTNRGAAYVFVRSGSTWTEQAKIVASDGAGSDQFGMPTLSGDGNTLMVGAVLDDVDSNVNEGSVYVFTRDGTVWTEQTRINASDGEAGDNFGRHVVLASDGQTAIVGSPAAGSSSSSGNGEGAAYVYVRSGAAWLEQTKLAASDGKMLDVFGFRVGLSADGGKALIGALGADIDGKASQGAAYVFDRSGSVWIEQAKLVATDGQAGDNLGRAVAISGDGKTANAGARWSDVGGNTNQGAAYIFFLPGEPVLTFEPTLLNFGDVEIGTTSTPLTTTLTNSGEGDATGLDFTGAGGAFAVDSGDCGTVLAAGESCAVSISFSPNVPGVDLATLQAISAEGTASNSVLLGGNGVEPDQPAPTLVFAPDILDFGDVDVGTTSPPLTTTLTNTGGADASGLAFDLPGGAFSVDTSACGTSLPAGASCDVAVTFSPTAGGPDFSSLAAGGGGGETSNTVFVAGNGVAPPAPELSFTPASLNFGDVEVGTPSATRITALVNSGSVDATGVTFSTPGDGFTVDTSACGPVLPAGANCSVTVTFTPSQTGVALTTLEATSAEGETSDPLILAGNGVEAGVDPEQVLIFDPEILNFGEIEVGDSGAPLTTTLTNIGDTTATGLTFEVPGGDFSVDTADCDGGLAAGESCTIGVGFAPTVPGFALARLQVSSAEGLGSNFVVTAGHGVEPGAPELTLTFDPEEIAFGDVEVTATSPPMFTVLTNSGTASATGLTFSAPGSGFAVDASNCGTVLPAGASCAVRVTFTPIEVGPAVGALQADSAEGAASNYVLLSANGVGPGAPVLRFAPGTINFGDVAVSTESAPRSTTLTNIGDTDATGLTFEPSGNEFLVDTSACGPVLAAGASCAVDVAFAPTVSGVVLGSLQAGSAEGETSNTVVLGGNGVEPGEPAATLLFDPTDLEFGDVEVGTMSAPQTTTLTNIGDTDATGLNIMLDGDGFVADASACGDVLAAGASCEVAVTFEPQAAGPASAVIEADSADGATSNFVLLAGQGVAGGPGDVVLFLTPSTLDFGEVFVGTTSSALTATLSNVGDADATALGFAVSDGVFAADTSACGTSLPAGASCEISVTFTPEATAPVSATLTAVAGAQGAVSNPVGLVGIGLASGPGVPVLTITPSELELGNVTVGSSSPPLTATLSNTGDVDATQLDFAVSHSAFSADTGDCGGVLAPGASCEISVTFTPAATGLVSATLEASSGEGAAVNLGLNGNGVEAGPGIPILGFAPASLYFGTIPVGSSSLPLVATLTNSGDVDATQLDLAISGSAFSVGASDCGVVLAAGASCQVQVVFTPSALGPHSATLLAVAGGGSEGVISNPVVLSGAGVAPGPGDTVLRFIPASLNFGDVEVGAGAPPLVTTLTNSGTTEVTGLTFSAPGNGFSADTSDCGSNLPAGASCEVVVGFTPAAPGLFAATLQADSNEGLTSNPVVLAGNGVEPGGETEETLAFSPATLNFDNVEVGTTSPPLITTLTNIGDVDASGLTFDLPADGFTADTSGCGGNLPAGASCEVSITYTPATSELTVDALQASADGVVSNSVVLAGNGVEPSDPDLVLLFDPISLELGDVGIGTTSRPLTTTLTNIGDIDATGLAFNAPGSGFAIDASACGGGLAAGASCEIEVTLTPAVLGPITAALEAGSAEGLSSNFVVLTGNGTPGIDAFSAMALAVDSEAVLSDGNFVFEPGERVQVAPAWRNNGTLPRLLDGIASNFTGPAGPSYEVMADSADYGDIAPGATSSCQDTGTCYEMEVGPDGAPRPTQHWDGVFDEALSDGSVKTWTLHLGESFTDTPREHLFYRFIETLFHNEVTLGCNASDYCPGSANTRAQMSVFVLRSLEGVGYQPLPCQEGDEQFFDVPADSPFCPWIEELAARGVVQGCGDGNFCPGAPVTRAQMSIFLLKTLEGAGYTPPECSGLFADVPCPSLFGNWIEDLFLRQITEGCEPEPLSYCPGEPNTRGQMAVFLTRTFGLLLYGP